MRRFTRTFVPLVLVLMASVSGGANLAGPPGGPLTMDLVVDHSIPRGDKTTYYLKATAGGGAPPYYFTWTNATPNVGNTVNPNTAVRTCLNTQHVTVTVCFTLAPSICDSVVVGGGIEP